MANAQKPEVNEEDLNRLSDLWVNFTVWMKWGVISVVIFMAIMAVTMV